jgi:nucleoside-diphosphate-sugar epimerase
MGRAFVTGGSGFVGRALIPALRRRGHEVRALVRSDRSARIVEAAGATPVLGSLDDRSALRQGMSSCDVVYHLAAHLEEWGEPTLFRRVNVEGTANVVAAAVDASVPRLIHGSTEAVLLSGPPLIDASETTPIPRRFAGFYGATKAEAERIVLDANAGGSRHRRRPVPVRLGQG